jgi:regulator of cell morphogenesis and NO signaling
MDIIHGIVTDTSVTLGELVRRRPATAALFERLGLDYCCGGRRTLEEACTQRGLDAVTVCALLDAFGQDPGSPSPPGHDVGRASIAELCDHIVAAHHEPLRAELARISERVATVVRVHGCTRPELADLQRVFETLRGELEVHMRREEHVLFPACRTLDGDGQAAPLDEGELALLEDDHGDTGEALSALRELCDDYDPAQALCGTHTALLRALHELELELHQHVHEENNILFPRVRERLAAGRV